MNKIKIIYDVVKRMKSRDSIKGEFKAEGWKDQEKTFGITNTFERSCKDGQVKGKANIEADCDGKKIKLENSIDLQGEACMHAFHKHHHAVHAGCMKGGLGKVTAVLGILSSIKLEEKEDRSAMLSLESANMPEEIKKDIQEMLKNGCEHHQHMDGNNPHHKCMKEFHEMEHTDFTLNMLINKDSEVEKVIINVKGERTDENNEKHSMRLAAELCLE